MPQGRLAILHAFRRDDLHDLRRLVWHPMMAVDWPATQFTCSFPGIKIPKWFGQLYRSGSHARIQLPPNLYDDSNWLGVAVCVYFAVHEHRPTNETTPDSEETCPAQTYPALVCELLTNVASERIFGAEFTNKAINPDIWQHACARRLVYKQDVDDLVQILTLSTLKAGSSPFSSSLVFSNNQEEVIQENPQPSENGRAREWRNNRRTFDFL
ncbi:hypothetical protein ACFX13_028240 [Malus domestica]